MRKDHLDREIWAFHIRSK